MNSEELEVSLRNEFESYLKNVLAEMKQDVSDFQEKFQTEFEKHKSQMDDVFKEFAERFGKEYEFDNAFKDSVVEHLRLSRDEGARITAAAIAEAEELEKDKPAVAPAVGFSEIRDAINDISNQDSQSGILKSLVNNVSQFTARGAFFIIKNEHLVGWRVFGNEAEKDEAEVREIFFPMANETLLSEAVRSLSAVESSYGTYSDDSLYLNKLDFGQPDKMYAIPLVARGRGVAVLYADHGTNGADVNIDAIETLVRVAGLTVELLAASQNSKQQKDESQSAYSAAETQETEQPAEETPAYASDYPQTVTTPSYAAADSYGFAQTEAENARKFAAQDETAPEEIETESPAQEYEYKTVEEESEPEVEEISEDYAAPVEAETEEKETEKEYAFASEETESPADYSFVSEPQTEETVEEKTETAEFEETQTAYGWSQPVESFETANQSFEPLEEQKSFDDYKEAEERKETADDFSTAPKNDYGFESNQGYETEPAKFEETAPAAETSSFSQWESNAYQETGYDSSRFEKPETPIETPSNSFEQNNGSTESFVSTPIETVATETVSTPPTRARFGERNVDLPIEVADDERRSHNDARRFARLLVSEIKLYNEQKVKEGREASDLYDRLREAIDRSREMYDKRVQPPVSSKFDYFHYELVSNLAEGDASKLGMSYPGAAI